MSYIASPTSLGPAGRAHFDVRLAADLALSWSPQSLIWEDSGSDWHRVGVTWGLPAPNEPTQFGNTLLPNSIRNRYQFATHCVAN